MVQLLQRLQQKNVSCTAKLMLANDTICEKEGTESENAKNYIVTTDGSFNSGFGSYDGKRYWFEWSQKDIEDFIEKNKNCY